MTVGIAYQDMLSDMENVSRAWDELLQLCENAKKIMRTAIFGEEQADECDEETDGGTPPKKYGVSLRKPVRMTWARYNYIPRAPRNLPYQRRSY